MNNLRNIRMKKGMSLAELQRTTGYPLRSLEDWESNKRQITAYHRIKQLSNVLDVDMDELMTYEDKCIFNGNMCYVNMRQVEDGVYISILLGYTEIYHAVIERTVALEIIKQIKAGTDIVGFLQ